jgi:hypothetical protein
MFRWPARLLPFLWLALVLVLVVVLTRGLHDDKRAARWSVTAVLVLLGAWQAYSDRPDTWKWAGFGALLCLALLWAFLRFGRQLGGRAFALLVGGTALVLFFQTTWMPSQANTRDYAQPTSRQAIVDAMADRGPGLYVQLANPYVMPSEWASPDKIYRDVLYGNMYSISGQESTTGYTGIWFKAHDELLCFNHFASTCPDAWERLWEVPEGETSPLVDLMGAQGVVLQKDLVDDPVIPDGWSVTYETDYVTVLTRDEPATSDGRITVVGDGVEVAQDEMDPDGVGERFIATTGGEDTDRDVTFARLAWPGYEVTVDGEPVSVETGPAGLLRVTLPAGLDGQEVVVAFSSPGWKAGLLALGIAGTLVVLLSVLDAVQRRRAGRPLA